MELNEKDEFSSEKGHGEGLNIHPVNLASDWQFGANQQNPFHSESSIEASTSCVSASMGDSFSPNVWDPPHSQNLASMGESNLQTSSSSSYLIPGRMLPPCSSSRSGFDRPLEYGWNSSNSLSNGAVFLQTGVGILHQSLSQFSSNSGFVERAAHLSCFGSGSFSDIVNSFQNMEPLIPFSANGNTHGVDIPLSSNVKLSSEFQSEKGELLSGAPTYVSLYIDHGATIGSLEKDDDVETLVKSSNEEKLWSEKKPDENGATEFGGNGQSDPPMNSIREFEREVSTKKRKKSSQDTSHSQVNKDLRLSAGATIEISNNKQKDELTPSSAPKSYGKSAKENSKNSDAPKEDYIHFRARRGQATNSHSLAERIRREKISDRMKLLQDLVPGCSKVTGKAIMLDQIINYVQSLQRQVEFLSMKLATVNPRLVFNLENHLSRDILQSKASSPAIGFSPNMTPSMVHPQLHLSQHDLVATRIPRIRNPSSALRRSTNTPIVTVNEIKEGSPQVSNVWEPELPNVVQMTSTATCPLFKSQVDHFPRDT